MVWRLEYRHYAEHQLGSPLPPHQCRKFKYREAAVAELNRLRATPGAEIVGGITPVPQKSAVFQEDFGFPPAAGPSRLTPNPQQKGRRTTAPAKSKGKIRMSLTTPEPFARHYLAVTLHQSEATQ